MSQVKFSKATTIYIPISPQMANSYQNSGNKNVKGLSESSKFQSGRLIERLIEVFSGIQDQAEWSIVQPGLSPAASEA